MFGYVTADRTRLTPEQTERYRAVYCGLCRCIGQRHGQAARLCLTYDMTFLVLLLDSLDEPTLTTGKRPCMLHPFTPNGWRHSRWMDYGADMNVALAYHNCLDDWQDDHNFVKLFYALRLRGAYRRIKRRWGKQCDCIERSLRELNALERADSADLDGASACFGRLMAGLLTPDESCFFNDTLRTVGDCLGRFIYVLDAVLDEEADKKEGHYNPVTRFKGLHGDFSPRPALELLMGDCCLAFESLPLEQDLDILRNILYSGVWAKWTEANQTDEKGQSPSM